MALLHVGSLQFFVGVLCVRKGVCVGRSASKYVHCCLIKAHRKYQNGFFRGEL